MSTAVFLEFLAGIALLCLGIGVLLAIAYPKHFDIRESPLRPGPRDPSEPD